MATFWLTLELELFSLRLRYFICNSCIIKLSPEKPTRDHEAVQVSAQLHFSFSHIILSNLYLRP